MCPVFLSNTMNRFSIVLALLVCLINTITANAYEPTPEILEARKDFSDKKFGIFIHWGIYSMFGQGEWYLNYGVNASEYAKAAAGFYPANFNAAQWVSAIKNSGAKYITFTSRHHDGFSMWHTSQSDYNIVDATPFKRDVLKELSDECARQGIGLNLYYSHIDWTRTDYPWGRTGRDTGRDSTKIDWPGYYNFMNLQLEELLTNYGKIGAIWFDGWWDHDSDSIPFDWQLAPQYAMIHRLQPSCLIGNNHHQHPFEGEDIQIFERDLPGENLYGLSGQKISRLPLETCQTMNGMWGYKIKDQDYKSSATLIKYLVKAAGMGANLLLNIGPQPDGSLPETALDRLREIGEWMDLYGATIYGTTAGDFPAQTWGTSTRSGDKLFIHITDPSVSDIIVPTKAYVRSAHLFSNGKSIDYEKTSGGIRLKVTPPADVVDYIVELDAPLK